ncbi:MAG: thiamine pyrophosphate-dependent enzyme [Myxococcota bacterium]|nr:thiamine pyrophosphate-dependent enzyme [Myxococcota bacterium]
MARNVCEEILRVLEGAGVRQIFGVTGDALNPLLDAIRHQSQIRWIGVRHEETAAFAAAAHYQVTGTLGVCAGTVGPGALHLINGLYNARKEGAAVLAITGQVPRAEAGSDFFQEVNLSRVFGDVCAFDQAIHSTAQMPRLIQQAVQNALSGPAVARIELPSDIAPAAVSSDAMAHDTFDTRSEVMPGAEDIAQAAEILNAARKPAILAGSGCRGARTELLQVAEALRAPIVHALKGSDVMEFDNPYWVGLTGLIGTDAGYHAIEGCDALLMLGTDFPYRVFYPKNVPIIQVDIRGENLGKRTAVTHGLLGHVRPTLAALLPRIDGHSDGKHLAAMQARRKKWDAKMDRAADLERKHRRLRPQAVAAAVSRAAADDAIYTVDVGECTVWAARHVRLRGSQRMIGSFNHGSLGAAVPAAIGAQAAHPKRQVIALCGDGGFGMSMQDFVTAVRYEWPINVIVFNNATLGFVKMEMEATGYPEYGDATDLVNPDFARYAEICGGIGIKVEEASEVEPAIAEALASPRPCIIDAFVNPNELLMPPKIAPAQAWGFSISKLKEILAYAQEKLL